MNTNTRITIHPSRQDISITVSLAHIAAILEHGRDSALPAGEALTLELDSVGNVTVIRDDKTVYSYSHPKNRARRAAQTATDQARQLSLFDARTA